MNNIVVSDLNVDDSSNQNNGLVSYNNLNLNNDLSSSNNNLLSSNNELSVNNPYVEIVDENSVNSVNQNNHFSDNSNNQPTTFNFNGQDFVVSPSGNDHFKISHNDKELTCYLVNIGSEKDLINISNYIKDSNIYDDVILINFNNDINITQFDNDVLFSYSRFLVINGNNVKIHAEKSNVHFLTTGLSAYVTIENLIIDNFINPIMNYGSVDLKNVNFTNNKLPISNFGDLYCTECSFFYNVGDICAGIYTGDLSFNVITNYVFENNIVRCFVEPIDIMVDENSIVNVFTVNGFNQKPYYYILNGTIIFKNITSPITRNLTIDINHTVEDIANKVEQDNGKSEIININIINFHILNMMLHLTHTISSILVVEY